MYGSFHKKMHIDAYKLIYNSSLLFVIHHALSSAVLKSCLSLRNQEYFLCDENSDIDGNCINSYR